MNQDDTVISLKPMGWIESDFKQKFGTPRQGSIAKHSRARVILARDWKGRGIFSGLEGFSHVWVVSYLHLSVVKRTRGKVHPPRLKGAKIGIMGSRSPHRPNNIGLTLARIVRCEGDHLELAEVDLVDGTPVLDLKPYLASADRPEQFTSGWTAQLKSESRECSFSSEAEADLRKTREPERIRQLIFEILKEDPRPPAYWGRQDARFAVWLAGLNIVFRFHEEKFTVVAIEPAPRDALSEKF